MSVSQQSASDCYRNVDCEPLALQAPEVSQAHTELRSNENMDRRVDYRKAHTWSCAAMMMELIAGCPPTNDSSCSLEVVETAVNSIRWLVVPDSPFAEATRGFLALLRSCLQPVRISKTLCLPIGVDTRPFSPGLHCCSSLRVGQLASYFVVVLPPPMDH